MSVIISSKDLNRFKVRKSINTEWRQLSSKNWDVNNVYLLRSRGWRAEWVPEVETCHQSCDSELQHWSHHDTGLWSLIRHDSDHWEWLAAVQCCDRSADHWDMSCDQRQCWSGAGHGAGHGAPLEQDHWCWDQTECRGRWGKSCTAAETQKYHKQWVLRIFVLIRRRTMVL